MTSAERGQPRSPGCHRLTVRWEPRALNLAALARQLAKTFDWLGTVPACAGVWGAKVGTRNLSCGDERAIARAVGAGAEPIGRVPVELFRQTFYLGFARRWRARLAISAGAARPLFGNPVPNALELCVEAALSVEALRQLLIGLIAIYRPVWGMVGQQSFPTSSLRFEVPMVGFLSYFSSWFGSGPALKSPAVLTDIPRFGTLVQAFPELLDPSRDDHRDQLEDLTAVLAAQGWLRPFSLDR